MHLEWRRFRLGKKRLKPVVHLMQPLAGINLIFHSRTFTSRYYGVKFFAAAIPIDDRTRTCEQKRDAVSHAHCGGNETRLGRVPPRTRFPVITYEIGVSEAVKN